MGRPLPNGLGGKSLSFHIMKWTLGDGNYYIEKNNSSTNMQCYHDVN